MTHGQRGQVIRQIETLFTAGTLGCLSDGELLDRSASRSGASAEVAFAALVERHGPMVLRVCRQVLGDPHDAHDAFQSTFLILARKAEAIRRRDSVASWLHGVALRVSAASRAAAARRKRHERVKAGASPLSTVMQDEPDLGGVLHEEVGRLPARYREAVVLCYLEGRTYEEAASRLNVPVGTVKSRLAWARDRLRARLSSRGFAPASGAVATMLAAESAQAAIPVPAFWVETTTEAAFQFASRGFTAIGSGMVPGSSAALAQGVIHAMIFHNVKIAATAGALLLAATGIGVVAQEPAPSPAASSTPAPTPAPAIDADRLDKLESKLDRLISALEKTTAREATIYRGAGGVYTLSAPPALPSLPPQAAQPIPFTASMPVTTAHPSDQPPAVAAGSTTHDAGQNTSVIITARRLAQIEARLSALEKKLEMNSPDGAPTQAADSPKR